MTDENLDHHIVVLGAGYTGTLAALGVARRTRRLGVRVTLVNPASRFTERLRMHQVATGQTLADYQLPDIVAGTGVDFVQATATAIDPARRRVALDGGARTLDYDTLVYAIGSVVNSHMVPGVAEHAYTLDDVSAAGRLADRLAELPDGATVAVAGGGLTGVEAAAEIAESHPHLRVQLLTRGEPGQMMGETARSYLRAGLDRLGVRVRTGAEVAKVLPGGVKLAGGEVIDVDATLWTTGFVAHPLAAEAGLAVDRAGRVVVDATLRSVSHPSVHAVGDAAAVKQPWGDIHGTCQSGMPTAAYTAATISRLLKDRKVKPFRFGYFHQPVSLGRRDAVIQFTRPDDTPNRWYLKGKSAIRYKEAVTSSPTPTFRMSKRFPVPSWLLGRRGGRSTRALVRPSAA